MADEESEIPSWAEHVRQFFASGAILYPSIGNPELVAEDDSAHLLIALSEKIEDDVMLHTVGYHLQFLSLENTLLFKKGELAESAFHMPFNMSDPDIVKQATLLDPSWATGAHPTLDIPAKGFQGLFNPTITGYFANGIFGDYKSPLLDAAKKIGRNDLLPFVYHIELDGPKLKAWLRKNVGKDVGQHCFVNWLALYPDGREVEEFMVTSAMRDFTLDGKHKFVGKRYQADSDAFTKSGGPRKGPDGPLNSFDILNWNFMAKVPVATLHPLFFYDDNPCLNVGYISDLHVVSRLEVMRRSDLQIIPGHSETLAGMLNTTGRAVDNLIKSAGRALGNGDDADGEVGLLVVGGDLIDFSMSCFPGADALKSDMPADSVRNLVNADDASLERMYDYGVDVIAFYNMIVDFYLTARKPVVILAGNHDAYDKPFGVSPRVVSDAKMANPGIPADNNLTVLEACLMYGDNYGKVFDKSNFKPKVMDLFYLLFTPIYSFTSRMAGMQMISLAWGNDERLIWHGPEIGHLPNAEEAMTAEEAVMVKKGADYGAKGYGQGPVKCLMVSHYTWVNYNEDRLQDGANQSFAVGDSDNISYFNLGACEKRKVDVFQMMLDKKIHYTLSGHSHRAGLYMLESMAGGKVTVQGHSVDDYPALKGSLHTPYIVVSDSAGPIPRENVNGDFNGWGSHNPTFAKMTFNAGGDLTGLRRVPTNTAYSKPRAAVAMDYVELRNQPWNATVFWIKELKTEPGMDAAYIKQMIRRKLTDFPLSLILDRSKLPDIPAWMGIVKASLFFKSPDPAAPGFIECPILYRPDISKWVIRDKDSFLVFMEKDLKDTKGFLSVELGTMAGVPKGTANRFDFGKPWVVVVDLKIITAGTGFLGMLADDFQIDMTRNWEFVKYPTVKTYLQLLPNGGAKAFPGASSASSASGGKDSGGKGEELDGGAPPGGGASLSPVQTGPGGNMNVLGVKIPSNFSV